MKPESNTTERMVWLLFVPIGLLRVNIARYSWRIFKTSGYNSN